MCGIAGVIGPLTKDQCATAVQRMNDAMRHRGPDDEGIWCDDGIGIGMRRLSIIDLSGGHQPMCDAQTGTTVVFNGEVYNYASLRANLATSTTLTTQSDTEVVLKTFARDKLGAVDSWNGMFAVALWNQPQRRLTLIRDRMGVKPLYYHWDGTTCVFASELKALLASQLVPRALDPQAVWDYLTFRYVPGPDCIWRHVRKLPPGHALTVSRGAIREESYWTTDVVATTDVTWTFANAEKEFRDLLLDAVQLRLVAADVPVGVLLSGGLDSSAVAAAAVELGHRNFHTFSIGFDEPEFSELSFASQMASHVGATHHEVVMDRKGFLDLLPEAVFHADEPLADLAAVPLLAVSRLARQHVKVVLSGEGSDEVLGGYDMDREVRRFARIRRFQHIPAPLLSIGARIGGSLFGEPFAKRARRLAQQPLAEWNSRDHPHISRLFSELEKRELFNGAVGRDSTAILQREYAAAASRDPLQQMISVYQKSWLVEDLLMKADKMSMAASLELRTPFLDYRLVEWANRQPNHVKVARVGRGAYATKYVLRRFCQHRIPEAILHRPKRGFPVPAYRWLQTGLTPWARDLLCGRESRLARATVHQRVAALCDRAEEGNAAAANRVWALVVLELWLRAWNVDLELPA